MMSQSDEFESAISDIQAGAYTLDQLTERHGHSLKARLIRTEATALYLIARALHGISLMVDDESKTQFIPASGIGFGPADMWVIGARCIIKASNQYALVHAVDNERRLIEVYWRDAAHGEIQQAWFRPDEIEPRP